MLTIARQTPRRRAGISHPDKVLWPATIKTRAFTKLDLVNYYLSVADRLLPHIVNRPLSIVRAPDGIEGLQFFQRHPGKAGQHVFEIRVSGEGKPYLGIKGIEGLVELAQSAALELHPWGARETEPDTPERIVFDMDPAPDVGFTKVISAAREVRARLKECGLEPFLKATGGKGLHVVVAVKSTRANPVRWPDVKTFARDICMKMAADAPDSYVAVPSRKVRTGRIFLDYLRNDRTSTAVAPWSPRARPGAPIAVPLDWSQLKSSLDPRSWNIGSIAKALRRTDPWATLASSAGSLSTAKKRLSRL
jgi:bifunctional non-homologous end joining protein LigD